MGNDSTVSLLLPDGGSIIMIMTLGATESEDRLSIERNIYRLNEHGNKIWQVGDYRAFDNSTFTNIRLDEQGRLIAYNFDGGEYEIDLLTGNICGSRLIK